MTWGGDQDALRSGKSHDEGNQEDAKGRNMGGGFRWGGEMDRMYGVGGPAGRDPPMQEAMDLLNKRVESRETQIGCWCLAYP